MQGNSDEAQGVIQHPRAQPMNEKLISHYDKQDESTKLEKNLSFLDDGSILISKLPKQIFDLFIIASPNIISLLGQAYFSFINMFFAQRTGDDTIIAAFGMGASWHSSTTLCIQVSICNGLFIQLAHAFGAKQGKLMQELFQRCQGILFGFGILSSILMLNTKSILMWLGMEEQISSYTGVYVVSCIPSIFGTSLYESTKQMLMAENIFDVPMKISLIIFIIHPIWLYLLIEVFDFGIAGIGLARGISEWLGFFALSFYINYKELIQGTWKFKYNLKIIFSEWIPFLKVAIPIGALGMLQWMFFDISTLLLAKHNDESMLAGYSSFQSIVLFFFMTPLGLSWTTNSYLGNAVGEGKKKVCQQFTKLIMISCTLAIIIYMIIGQLLKGFIYDIFTVNDEMGKYFEFSYNFYIYGYLIGDFYQITLSGILKCCDQQNFAALCYLIVYYIIGLPLTVYLTFTLQYKLTGVLITQTLVAAIVSIIFFIKILNVDWDESLRTVKLRNQKEQEISCQEMHEIENN